MASVEQMYKDFGVLADAKDKVGEHETEFLSILSGVNGGTNQKRLASQFIARFFRHFPTLSEKVLDAMFDLCEDDDITIRRQAIKDLPTLVKGAPEHLPRIADVLTQLLQTEESAESSMVQQALISLFRTDPKGCLGGLFSQILQGDEVVRDRAIAFLKGKLRTLTSECWTSDVEDVFVTESKKVLKDVTGEEFMTFMTLLSEMESMKTLKGRTELLDIVIEQADLDQPFDAADPDGIDRLCACVRQAMPFFSKNVHATKFVVFMIDNVLPVLNDIKPAEQENGEGGEEEHPTKVDVQLDLLKLFAEMCNHLGEVENVDERMEKLYARLVEYMPVPPAEENSDVEADAPKLQFSYVECLMFAFHKMGGKHPDFLTAEENADRLKDFKLRLQYFARGVQVYIKQLRMALQGKTGEALKTEENKIKVAALKITSNINTLIKDLFHSPPSYKSTVTLSWKPLVPITAGPSPGQKRSSINPITFEGEKGRKAVKTDRPVYAPPSGKFSDKAGSYEPPATGGYRGGYRGGFRGRSGFRGRGRGRGGYRGGYNRY